MKIFIAGTMLFATLALGQAVPLTQGPGMDTEAMWSPDGRKIVFQRETDGNADLLLLDLQTMREKKLVSGMGDARYPCWSPDGESIVYSFGRLTTTAHQGAENGYNLFAIPATGGEAKRLTSGRVRDYTPMFSPDGKELFFTTTRGLDKNNAALYAMNLGSGEMRLVYKVSNTNAGMLSPALSPNGRILAFAAQFGWRDNWQIVLSRSDKPKKKCRLTDAKMSMYAPRWSPDGTMLACTGYRKGDPGWGIYLIRLSDGALCRLPTGRGNARSPSWSPDGKELVFENNRGGVYKLYRLGLPAVPAFFPSPLQLNPPPEKLLLMVDAGEWKNGLLADHSGRNHKIDVKGTWKKVGDGGIQCGEGYAQVEKHEDFALAQKAFYVKVEVFLESNPKKLQIIAVGDYPEHRLGWQIYVNSKGCGAFNSRGPSGGYVGAITAKPLPVGKRLALIGVRDEHGKVSLLVRGGVEAEAHGNGIASMSYGPPNQIRIGCQFNGASKFLGRLYHFELGSGIPKEKRETILSLQEVGEK